MTASRAIWTSVWLSRGYSTIGASSARCAASLAACKASHPAQVIDQPPDQRLLSRPDAAATHRVDGALRHPAALADPIEEGVIELLDLVLELPLLVGREAAEERLGVGSRSCLVSINRDAQLLEQPADVGLPVKDADRAGDREGKRKHVATRARHEVAPARRDRAHRYDEQLVFQQRAAAQQSAPLAPRHPPALSKLSGPRRPTSNGQAG